MEKRDLFSPCKSSDFKINRSAEFSTPCSPPSRITTPLRPRISGQAYREPAAKRTRIILTGRIGIRAIVGTNNLVVCLDGVGVKIHARINYRAYVERGSAYRRWRTRVCDDRWTNGCTHTRMRAVRVRSKRRDKLSGSRSRR